MYAQNRNGQLHFIGIPTIAIAPLLLASSGRSLQVSADCSINPPPLNSLSLSLSFPRLNQEISHLLGFFCLSYSSLLQDSGSTVSALWGGRKVDFNLAKSGKPMLCLPLVLLHPICATMDRCHHKLLAIVATSMYFCIHHDGEVSRDAVLLNWKQILILLVPIHTTITTSTSVLPHYRHPILRTSNEAIYYFLQNISLFLWQFITFFTFIYECFLCGFRGLRYFNDAV